MLSKLKRLILSANRLFFPLLALLLSAAPVLAMEVPRFLAFYPILIGIIMSGYWRFLCKGEYRISCPYLIYMSCISGLCLLSSVWSLKPADALEEALTVTAILCGSTFLFSLLRSIPLDGLRPYFWMLPVGLSVAAILCSIEIYLDMPLHKIIRATSEAKTINSSVMNRGIVFAILCFFPAVAFIKSGIAERRVPLYILLIFSTLLMLFMTQSQSAQLAFLAGVIIFFAFPYRYDSSYTLLAGVIIAALLLTPLITQLMFYYFCFGAIHMDWLKQGYAAHRMEIWDFVSRYAMQNPLYGYGIEATRYVEAFDHRYMEHKQPTALHPHNFAVQIWIEFGLLGAILGSLFLTSILYRIKRMAIPTARILLALFTTILCVSATGYGIWQAWWLGSLVLSIGLACLISEPKSEQKNDRT